MSDSIYVLQDGKILTRLEVQGYEKEVDFQQLLENHPELLSGDQINSEFPREWLLVAREASIPSETNGSSRFFVDLFFLDQDAIPTLVEVKRKDNNQLRREVVGQMLDYAANATSYWSSEWMKNQFVESCRVHQKDPEAELTRVLGDDADRDAFWQLAFTKLRAGEVRLLFVADRIPTELQRIVEFLNERMSPTEILALELKRYAGQALSTHIPRILGQTSEAQLTKATGSPTAGGTRTRITYKQDENIFVQQAAQQLGEEGLAAVHRIFDFAKTKSDDLGFGNGKNASVSPKFVDISKRGPVTLWANGDIELKLNWLNDSPTAISFGQRFSSELKSAGLPSEDTTHKLQIDLWQSRVTDLLGALERAVDGSRADRFSA
jgi:hypothetical protein